MSWWKRLLSRGKARPVPERLTRVQLSLAGWAEEETHGKMRVWRHPSGDVLSLSLPEEHLDLSEDEASLRNFGRTLAESRSAGLIEVGTSTYNIGGTMRLIYKRLQKPAYIYTGMLFIPFPHPSEVWTLVAGEHGTTGVREAIVTSEMMEDGQLTIDSYLSSWAQDPYDAKYHGVDRSVLRFISDDERFDGRFPDHPLSVVRRVLAVLPSKIVIASRGPTA